MEKFKARLPKFALGSVVGASLGFAYYYFIGCNTGTCAITGNPIISTSYGALMGFVWMWPVKKRTK
ncbi:MAG: hypothetical protein HN657_07275 [Candidatus Marinimicrobia bacterium]|nr:hypothetical protein [Candidatus Neomarinimicrobiota bacterium]MBT3496283.1 hypothetical protein [Candidatus Neomarinimicrobiota bacterium]MBT3691620.1 hypothetical protein [Candidatus Neomarinimicrobiota bacterium]MBT3732348.1 hypothetical protein [Candidatus Neomarinimicrobiota bacterium]MBT4144924.1 hypothetical protein [Candidatus Neomarinimicrobiota bacterium]